MVCAPVLFRLSVQAQNPVRLVDVWSGVGGPRQAKKLAHDLVELLVLAVCAALSGADAFAAIERVEEPPPANFEMANWQRRRPWRSSNGPPAG